MAKRVQTHVLEKVVGTLMVLFGIAAVFVFFSAMQKGAAEAGAEMAIIQILLIIVLAILAQTVILIRLYELNLK